MFEFTINIRGVEQAIHRYEQQGRDSSDAAIRDAAEFALARLRPNLSHKGQAAFGKLGTRSGRLLAQASIKYFQQRNGLMGAAVKVQGDRRFIMHFHEHGTASHGRLPRADTKGLSRVLRRRLAAMRGTSALPARKVFETTWKAIERSVVNIYVDRFNQEISTRFGNT